MPPQFGSDAQGRLPEDEQPQPDTLELLKQAVLQQPQNAPPPYPQIDNSGRIALGVLGALDPEAFQTTVLPLLREQASRGILTEQQQAERREANIRALQAVAGLEGAQASRDIAAEQRAQTIELQEQGLELRRQKQEADEQAELKEDAAMRYSYDTAVAEAIPLMKQYAEIVGALSESEMQSERFGGALLSGTLANLTEKLNRAQDDEFVPTKQDVDDFNRAVGDAKEIAAQIQGQGASREAAALGRAAKGAEARELTRLDLAEFDQNISMLEGLQDLDEKFEKVKGQLYRGSKYLAKSEEMKEFLAAQQAANLAPRKEYAGTAVSSQEFEKQARVINDAGALMAGDAETVGVAIRQLKSMVSRDMSAFMRSRRATGFDVSGLQAVLDSSPASIDPVVRSRADMPDDAPEGSIWASEPNEDGSRLLLTPDGEAYMWYPEAPVNLEPGAESDAVPELLTAPTLPSVRRGVTRKGAR